MLRSLLLSSLVLSFPVLSNPLDDLAGLARSVDSEHARVSALFDSKDSGKSVLVRRQPRADGSYIFVITPGYRSEPSVDHVTSVDLFAQSIFDAAAVRIPLGKLVDATHGFDTFQYFDGQQQVGYVLMVPKVAKPQSVVKTSVGFCAGLTEPSPPRSFPRHTDDTHAIGPALDPDSYGIWFTYTWRFEVVACSSCTNGLRYVAELDCDVADPQPTFPNPNPNPGGGGSGGGTYGVIPRIIPGNAGWGWTFRCTIDGEPVDCATGLPV